MKHALALLLLVASSMAQEIKRPTADSDPGASIAYGCSGTNVASTSLPNAYDAAGLTTSSTETAFASTTQNRYKNRKLSSWQSTGNSYSALTLNINSSSPGFSGSGGNACVKYSTDGGGTWTSVHCSFNSWAQSTSTISLSASQDLSKLQVSACVSGEADTLAPGNDSVTLYDVWTAGTISTPAPAAGSGNTSGLNARRITFVF